MWGWSEPNYLGAETDQPVVVIGRLMEQRNFDGHVGMRGGRTPGSEFALRTRAVGPLGAGAVWGEPLGTQSISGLGLGLVGVQEDAAIFAGNPPGARCQMLANSGEEGNLPTKKAREDCSRAGIIGSIRCLADHGDASCARRSSASLSASTATMMAVVATATDVRLTIVMKP